MAAQQIQFQETIRAMKLAMKRNRATSPAPSSSDSDSDDLHVHTNRGNKLKRSARYAHEGRLDTTGGQAAYKRKVRHAGYERQIIAKRPKLYDDDGDVVDPLDIPSDAEGDERAYGEAVREDPFGHVQLEHLLRPLTSAAELPQHPSLSVAYTSQALTQMAAEAAAMVRRETASLWKAKRLLRRFRGDGGWMACERFETGHDELLLHDGELGGGQSAVPSVIETEAGASQVGLQSTVMGEENGNGPTQTDGSGNGDVMEGIEARDYCGAAQDDTQTEGLAAQLRGAHDDHGQGGADTANSNGNGNPQHHLEPALLAAGSLATNPAITDLQPTREHEEDESSNSNSNAPSNPSASAPSHAMTTRARARSPQPQPSSPSPSPSDSASIPSIHPWFLTPPDRLADDRDLGLPANEAEETRRLLMLYVQKQENIVRQLSTLYTGLQKTDRIRREVYLACKAEGHMVPVVTAGLAADGKTVGGGGGEGSVAGAGAVQTEMSDGEDWYDVADWGLQSWELSAEGGLEKGKDEVEDAAEEEGRRVGGRRRRVVGR
ncbi:hypothetical protein LTR36_000927 [Oleoguttula mirabilis]|uniref:Transcriptional regulatory protein RXT2 N-terminal domain-containing protein n=1 Tax=Oleoguttula mirabilis TaxID=1507867 RepID=A0AAV9JNY1_9PEZI|nr:hypothetical protein LTR36_000927 [Oleoguttula mirabilis]